ncbi:MAG: type II secretion system protein [Phycisphaerales bacterium]|nr:type II secretion system protein [Phycisphaerales bacterium]
MSRPNQRLCDLCGISANYALSGWGARASARRGFTLVETAITVIIIAVLAGILLLAIGKGAIFARESAERQTVNSLKTAVILFKNDFGFYPPLVKDATPVAVLPNGGGTQPNTYLGKVSQQNTGTMDSDRAYLQGFTSAAGGTPLTTDRRYSELSLPYYLMGALDADPNNTGKPVDGVLGPKFTRPNEDGTFAQRGAATEALFDFGKGGRGVRESATRLVFLDRWQSPIRYYRWNPRPDKQSGKPVIMVPRCVGDPIKNPSLASAEFAIVSLGNDKRTDEQQPRRAGETNQTGPAADPATDDDIVEVGP